MSGRLVIVGTGRSGTGYVARLLEAAGVNCGHESVFGPVQSLGIVPPDWQTFDADASWLAVPALDDHDGPVALGLRHPWRVIDSLDRVGLLAWERHRPRANHYRAAIASWAPAVFAHRDPLVRAADFAAVWPDSVGLRVPELVFKVEELTPLAVVALADLAGVTVSEELAARALATVPPDVNSERAPGDRRSPDEVRRYLYNRAPGDVWAFLQETYGAAYPDAFPDLR